jgi:metal-responsive CopG/Arc/MetJ family transcriptional regulator
VCTVHVLYILFTRVIKIAFIEIFLSNKNEEKKSYKRKRKKNSILVVVNELKNINDRKELHGIENDTINAVTVIFNVPVFIEKNNFVSNCVLKGNKK